MDKKVNEKKKRYAIIISFLVLMICITGGTYAYFALTASNNSVTGTVGGASLNLTVTKVYPTSEHNSKNMIPQLESTLDEAISLDHKCVDGNGNVICQVYSATVTNVGSTSSVLNGTISFEGLEREPGLYDDDWNLLVSWDELVNDYGLIINRMGLEESYGLAYIINNNDVLSTNVKKIVVDRNVDWIGDSQFYQLPNIEEISFPDNISFEYDHELFGLSNLKTIYYSGDYDSLGVFSSQIVIKPIEELVVIPNLKWMRINDSNTLGNYNSYYASVDKALFEENKSFGANVSNTYYFVFWIDETGEVQYDNGEFRANIEFDSSIDGLTSTVRPLLTDYMSSLYNDGSNINTVYIAGDESKQQVSLNSVQKLMLVDQDSTYGEEYRYYGINPNNYVEYNGELWRIISSSKVFSDESDTIGESRVRIIRDESIGNYAWNNEGTNDWNNSTLMCQLNTMYYNDSITACEEKELTSLNVSLNEEAKLLVDDALWYLGGIDNERKNSLYANDYYYAERNNSAYGINSTRWVGKVGIMYASDYTYATDLSKCKLGGAGYSHELCSGFWLNHNNWQWLLFSNSDFSSMSFYVMDDGWIYDDDMEENVLYSLNIYPVVVLKSNVKVMGGNGTSGDPYKIALG